MYCMFACVCLCAFARWLCVRGQARIEKVVSLGLRCLQQLGATQPKNEEVKGGDVDKRLGSGGGGGQQAGMRHESWRHSISLICEVLLQ